LPTDLNLLSDAREKSEELIDVLYNAHKHIARPRTYREIARKEYLHTAQKKVKSKKEIRSAVRKQLNYLKRNLKSIDNHLDAYQTIPLNRHQYKYLLVIHTLCDQQRTMFETRTHSIDHRIVSIHQPHVRPIVRGKTNANVEFGAKIQVSLMNGFAFLDDLSWEAFNEGTRLMASVEKYKALFGYYPKEVLVDKIYCNRANRAALKELKIMLRAKPLGRPKAVDVEHVRPGERNPIEGKFGQAKTAYGLNRVKARLQQTSQSWIATIVLVLNLVRLAGQVPFTLIHDLFTFSANRVYKGILRIAYIIVFALKTEMSKCLT
jgi:IS5 family transposase